MNDVANWNAQAIINDGLDRSMTDAVQHLASIFLIGLEENEPLETLVSHFKAGLAKEIAAHRAMAAAVAEMFANGAAP